MWSTTIYIDSRRWWDKEGGVGGNDGWNKGKEIGDGMGGEGKGGKGKGCFVLVDLFIIIYLNNK